jgi:DNA-binding NtrC family response regulator
MPALREREDDVPLLAQSFIAEFNRKHRTEIEGISEEAAELLKAYPWPGNVRELRNIIERAVVLAKSEWIDSSVLPPYIRSTVRSTEKLVIDVGTTTMADAERELLIRTLEHAGKNKAEAARQLGVDVKTIYNKLKAYNIES